MCRPERVNQRELSKGQTVKGYARLLSVLGTWKLRGENPAAKLYAALS